MEQCEIVQSVEGKVRGGVEKLGNREERRIWGGENKRANKVGRKGE